MPEDWVPRRPLLRLYPIVVWFIGAMFVFGILSWAVTPLVQEIVSAAFGVHPSRRLAWLGMLIPAVLLNLSIAAELWVLEVRRHAE